MDMTAGCCPTDHWATPVTNWFNSFVTQTPGSLSHSVCISQRTNLNAATIIWEGCKSGANSGAGWSCSVQCHWQSEVCRSSANSAQLSDTSTVSSTAKLAARSGLAEEPCVLTLHKQHFNQSQLSTSHKLCSLGFGCNLGSFSRYTQTHLLG